MHEPSLGMPDEAEKDLDKDDHDYVPHFQRVSITGEDTSGVIGKKSCIFSTNLYILVCSIRSHMMIWLMLPSI